MTVDFQRLTNKILKEVIEEKLIEKTLKEQISKAIVDLIKDNFNSWSMFGKQIKEEIKNKLKLDLSSFSFAEYNQILSNIFADIVDKQILIDGKKSIENSMKKLLKNVKNIGAFLK